MLEKKIKDDDTREAKGELLTRFDQEKCRKKKSGDHYLCKEPEKGYLCMISMKFNNNYYCLIPEKEK